MLDLPMTVEEAYAAIPHRRTAFDFERSSMSEGERRYLAAVFHLIDQGTRVRVVGMVELSRDGRSEEEPVRRLGELRAAVARLRPPLGLETYHDLILEALARERAVFESWEAAGAAWEHRADIGGDPDVQAASAALRGAYGILMQRYGADAPAANADALFDVHCAFDFI